MRTIELVWKTPELTSPFTTVKERVYEVMPDGSLEPIVLVIKVEH